MGAGEGWWASSEQSKKCVRFFFGLQQSAFVANLSGGLGFTVPEAIGFSPAILNPALPSRRAARLPQRLQPVSKSITSTNGIEPGRVYLDIPSPESEESPRRASSPEVSRISSTHEKGLFLSSFAVCYLTRSFLPLFSSAGLPGSGLDDRPRLRRADVSGWKYIYIEDGKELYRRPAHDTMPFVPDRAGTDPNAGLVKKCGAPWKNFTLPFAPPYKSFKALPEGPRDEAHPRIFHMFWTGPFTDKPYLTLLSFLYAQNLGLHLPPDQPGPKVFRPQFWRSFNPGPAISAPNPNALWEMFEPLKTSPWASPFSHLRLKDFTQFRL